MISKNLSERERYVSLLIDEVYVNPNLSFKNTNILGHSMNNWLKLLLHL
jgi:hypothetical protein